MVTAGFLRRKFMPRFGYGGVEPEKKDEPIQIYPVLLHKKIQTFVTSSHTASSIILYRIRPFWGITTIADFRSLIFSLRRPRRRQYAAGNLYPDMDMAAGAFAADNHGWPGRLPKSPRLRKSGLLPGNRVLIFYEPLGGALRVDGLRLTSPS
jgi:hypothetical protein